jgi:putative DNA primase/helicase
VSEDHSFERSGGQIWQDRIRHDLAMAFNGLAQKQDLNANLVMQIVQRICQINNDLEEHDRLDSVRSTFSKPMDDLIGYKGLVECLGQSAAKGIADRIAAYSGKPTHLETVKSQVSGSEIINFGQFSDKGNVTEAKMGSALAQ